MPHPNPIPHPTQRTRTSPPRSQARCRRSTACCSQARPTWPCAVRRVEGVSAPGAPTGPPAMARAGPHARLESAAASDHAGGRASGAPASPAGTSRPASPRLACSGGPEATFGPDGPDQQGEHRDDGSARQPQGRDDRRRPPNQREGLAAQRVRHAMLELALSPLPLLPRRV